MPVEFFSWTTPQLAYLRSHMLDMFERDEQQFLADVVTADEHNVETLRLLETYVSNTKRRLAELCEHFEVNPGSTLSEVDHSIVDRIDNSWIEDVRFANGVDDIIKALVRATGERVANYFRPKAFANANERVLEWLQQRPADVDRIHHRSFEAIVAELLKDKGWDVELTKQTRDGGYDVLAVAKQIPGLTLKMVVECKLYDVQRSVGSPMVDRLMGVARREHADIAMLVTNSRFTAPAWARWEESAQRDLALIDRDELMDWLRTR